MSAELVAGKEGGVNADLFAGRGEGEVNAELVAGEEGGVNANLVAGGRGFSMRAPLSVGFCSS